MGTPTDDAEHQRRYYETLIEVSPTAIVATDADSIVTSWNPAATTLFGYAADEAIGRHINDLVANDPVIRDEAMRIDRELRGGPGMQPELVDDLNLALMHTGIRRPYAARLRSRRTPPCGSSSAGLSCGR